MQKIVILAVVLFLAASLPAQEKVPVQWSFQGKKTGADSWEILLTATVEKGWHIYSQSTPEGGPVPTTINFTTNPLISFTGPVKELGKLEEHDEPLFGVKVKQYSNKVVFVQTVKVKANVKTALKGTVEYMVCNNIKCLPPKTESFTIPIK
jgi:thiol:disulfide interchange protein DsbD